MSAGQSPLVIEAQVAGDAKNGSVADRLSEVGCSRERRVRLHGQNDEIGLLDDVRVLATVNAELLRCRLRACLVARADEHLVLAALSDPPRERTPECPGSADDRDLHVSATASSAASARRFRAVESRMSVCVTIGRTPSAEISPASSASASSSTRASISPG